MVALMPILGLSVISAVRSAPSSAVSRWRSFLRSFSASSPPSSTATRNWKYAVDASRGASLPSRASTPRTIDELHEPAFAASFRSAEASPGLLCEIRILLEQQSELIHRRNITRLRGFPQQGCGRAQVVLVIRIPRKTAIPSRTAPGDCAVPHPSRTSARPRHHSAPRRFRSDRFRPESKPRARYLFAAAS